MPKTILALVTLAVLVPGTVPVAAQSAAELLEKGIYLEETAGQLDQAIEVYRRIVNDATAGRAHVAEALLRLGLCHFAKGDAGAAAEAFERVIADYPEQEPFVARARLHLLPEAEPLELLPAPWEDGEVMRLSVKLASGTLIGAGLLTADLTEPDPAGRGGEELWRLRVRRKFFTDADNQSITQVLARRETMAPVRGVFRHSTAGDFEAEYRDGVVHIDTVGTGAKRREKVDGRTFDGETLPYLFRRLPLEVGFKTSIRQVEPLAAGVSPVDVEVTGKETIAVPAGEFECYRVELSIGQVFWYSTDPRRVLVKLEALGMVIELDEVYVQEPGGETEMSYRWPPSGRTYRWPPSGRTDKELGFAVTLPPDWLHHNYDSHGTEVLFLLDPGAEAQTRMEIRRSGAGGDGCSFQAAAHGKLEQARTALRDYALRDGTWREWDFAGWPAVSFVGDYLERDVEKVHYWTFIQHGELCVDFTLKVAADRFAALRTVFDSILESYRGPPPPTAAGPPDEAAVTPAETTDTTP